MKAAKPSQFVLAGVFVVLLVLFGVFFKSDYVLHVTILIMMNAVLGCSLRLINLSGQMSLAHGGFVTIGAYTSALLLVKAGVPSTWLALLASGVIAAVIAFLVGIPFSRLKGIYFTIVGVFFVQVVVLTVQQWKSVTGGTFGIIGVPRPDSFLGITFSSKLSFYMLALGLMVVSMLILWGVEHSRVGLTFLGIKQADSLAESVGINTMVYKVAAFTVGGFFAGLWGGFHVQYVSAVDPTIYGFIPTIYMLIYMIVGGENAFVGPMIGAAVLTLLPEVARPLKAFMPLLFAGILILVIYLLPEGLVGLPSRLRNLFTRKMKGQSDAAS